MNQPSFQGDNNLTVAENYYKAMLIKNFDQMARYLHDSVYFISPLAEIQGKGAVVSAAKNFGEILQDLQMRAQFENGDQIMFAYDMIVPAPIGKFRAAVLMEFTDHLISRIELFYDARPFEEKKADIFEDNKG